jgi:hypothetical protein
MNVLFFNLIDMKLGELFECQLEVNVSWTLLQFTKKYTISFPGTALAVGGGAKKPYFSKFSIKNDRF